MDKLSDKQLSKLNDQIVIIIDSREKSNSHIIDCFIKYKIKYIIKKLDFGDYSFMLIKNNELGIIEDIDFSSEIAIERKANAEEISGNFTNGRDRFKREFKRGNGKIRLLIENSNYSNIAKGNYKTELTPKSFLASLHSFQEQYNAPFFFVDKEYSALYIYNTFKYYIRNKLK